MLPVLVSLWINEREWIEKKNFVITCMKYWFRHNYKNQAFSKIRNGMKADNYKI